MKNNKKIIIYVWSLFLIVFITYIVYYFIGTNFIKKQINKEPENNDMISDDSVNKIIQIEDKALQYINNWDFKSAYEYYDSFLSWDISDDEKMMFKVRKALAYFSEWEILNQQKIFFKKWKNILDVVKNENSDYLEYWEFYRVLWYWYEIIRDYENALKNYEAALNYSTDTEHLLNITWWIAHVYMLMWNPYLADEYIQTALNIDQDNVFINHLYLRNLWSLWDYKKSVEIAEKIVDNIDNIDDLSEIYYTLSNMAFLNNDSNKALEYVKKCLETKENYWLCYLSKAKIYYFMWNELWFGIAKNELEKALLYDKNSAIVYEYIWYVNEVLDDIDWAISTHLNNYNNIVDKDTNLFDNQKIQLKQKLLIILSRLYSKKWDKDNSLKYLNILKNNIINYYNLKIIENQLIQTDWWDFKLLLENSSLKNYLSLWKTSKIIYNREENCTDKNSKICINSTLFMNLYKTWVEEESPKKIDILNIKKSCRDNKDNLDDTLIIVCKIFNS